MDQYGKLVGVEGGQEEEVGVALWPSYSLLKSGCKGISKVGVDATCCGRAAFSVSSLSIPD